MFGKTEASFYTQIRISSDNVDFAPTGSISDIVLDSVIFALEIADHYGNLDAQTFEIYEVNEDMYIDSTYYTTSNFATSTTNIVKVGTGTITPSLSKVASGSDSLTAQLRIKLSNSFGQKILNESGNTTLSNNENFTQFIKGLQVKVNNPSQISSEGAILSLNLLSEYSKITLHYRNIVTIDTLEFDLLLNTYCARVNHVEHDYTGTSVGSQIIDSTLGKNNVYIQGLVGINTQIELTDIMSLKDSNFIINKAVLTFPVDYTSGSAYEPNSQLIIVRNEEDNKYLLPDQTQYSGLAGLANVGGQWDEDEEQYEFVITRYINNVLNGNYPNNKLTIETASALVTPNRAILFGSNSLLKKPKLTITYTKY